MLRIRPVSDLDVRQLWEWVNEPATRASAFRSDPIPWEEHLAWFGRKYTDGQCRMYIVEADGLRVGQVRFDIDADGRAEVDVSIAAECRGRGYGAEALRLGSSRLFLDTGCTEVVAHIKPDNAASARAFEKAGFVADVASHHIVRMTLTRRGSS